MKIQVLCIHVFVASCMVSRTKAGILLRCEIGWPSEALPEFTCEGDVHIIAFNLLNERMLIYFIWTNTGLYITDSLSRTKQRWRRQCKGVKMISSKALRELSCDGDVHINGFQLARWKIFRELHRLLQKLIYPLYNLHISSLSPVCEIGHNKPGAINAIYLKVRKIRFFFNHILDWHISKSTFESQ